MFVDEEVQPSFHLPRFTEENQLLKQEDVTLAFPPPSQNSELVLTDQLTLLLEVHLDTELKAAEFSVVSSCLRRSHRCSDNGHSFTVNLRKPLKQEDSE